MKPSTSVLSILMVLLALSLAFSQTADNVSREMAEAARQFIGSLASEKQAQVRIDFDDEARYNFHYIGGIGGSMAWFTGAARMPFVAGVDDFSRNRWRRSPQIRNTVCRDPRPGRHRHPFHPHELCWGGSRRSVSRSARHDSVMARGR